MRNDGDLKRFEKRAYLSFFRDGLWDICLGLFLAGWGAGLVWDQAAFNGIWFVALYFIVLGLKRRWILPRSGYVRMDTSVQRRRAGFVLVLGVLALFGVVALGLFTRETRPDWLTDYFPLLFSFVIAVPVTFVAAWFMVRRYYLYSLLVVAGGAVAAWSDVPWEYTFFAAGGIIVVTGIVLLTTFLRAYRQPAAGERYGED
jgi:hypothetical protein